MRRPLYLVGLCLISHVVSAEGPADAPYGFFADSAAEQRGAEAVYLRTPTPDGARAWLFQLTQDVHIAGTPAEKKVADFVHDQLAEMGARLDPSQFYTEIAAYEVYLNYPIATSLKLIEPVETELSLHQESYDVDKNSTDYELPPTFHGYSAPSLDADGNPAPVSGEVVYVNYGSPEDYAALEAANISLEGKIALGRYGLTLRGTIIEQAALRGAIGVLVYSDPEDTGYDIAEPFPTGPMKPETGIEYGSVQYAWVVPGDPTTPGFASPAPGERKLKDLPKELERARCTLELLNDCNLPDIPSLPISYGAATQILQSLGGPVAPAGAQGGLPFTYHSGPGGAVVEMNVELEETYRTIYDIFAVFPGAGPEADQEVILGNHRDAWGHGASDPNSGTAVLMETARGLVAAVESGWTPRRTLRLSSWDAEEYSLVGSTEYGESVADRLSANAVAYVNTDVTITGSEFEIVAGIPSLRDLVLEVTGELEEPRKGGTVADAWRARLQSEWAASGPVDLDDPQPFEVQMAPPGTGSDFTVFTGHLGVPIVDFMFSGPYGVYHTAYDNFYWMETFGDPGFIYHALAARFYGLMAMRLTQADVVPFQFTPYGPELVQDLRALETETVRAARQPGASADSMLLDPDFGPVYDALERFSVAGVAADAAVAELLAQPASAGRDAKALAANAAIIQVERAFLNDAGLPLPDRMDVEGEAAKRTRAWYRHQLYAPGPDTGYAPWPFPGLKQAIQNADAASFAAERQKVIGALDAGAAKLSEVALPHKVPPE